MKSMAVLKIVIRKNLTISVVLIGSKTAVVNIFRYSISPLILARVLHVERVVLLASVELGRSLDFMRIYNSGVS